MTSKIDFHVVYKLIIMKNNLQRNMDNNSFYNFTNPIKDIIYSLLHSISDETSININDDISDLISCIYGLDNDIVFSLINNNDDNIDNSKFKFSIHIKLSFIWLLKVYNILNTEISTDNLKNICECLLLLSTPLSYEFFKIDDRIGFNNISINELLNGIIKWSKILDNKDFVDRMKLTEKDCELLLKIYFNDIRTVFLQLMLYFNCILVYQVDNEKIFYNEVLKRLLEQFFKSRILAIFINANYNDILNSNNVVNNTTLFQVVYSYDNGDLYNIRFDSKHKGVEGYHFNIGSFGNEKQFFPYNLDEKDLYNNFKTIRHGLYQYYFTENEVYELLKKENANKMSLVKDREHFTFNIDSEIISQYMRILLNLMIPFVRVINLKTIEVDNFYNEDVQLKKEERQIYDNIKQNIEYNTD